MKIRCTGSPQNVERRFVCRALRFYLRHLVPSLMEGFTVNLVFMDTKGADGAVDWLDKPTRSKKFRLHLHHTMSELKTLTVLAHECVHIKQYSTGQLGDCSDEHLVMWEGVPHHFDEDSLDYWFSPWEIEAFGKQAGLLDLFITDYNSRK